MNKNSSMSNLTNNRWLSVITLLLLTANIVTLALLWANKSHEKINDKLPPPDGRAFEFITQELKLDSAQQQAYTKLREEQQLEQRENRDSINKAKDNLFALLKQTDVTDSLINVYSSRIGHFEHQRDFSTFKHFQKLRVICNKEQQTKFDNIIQEALRSMGRPGRHQGPPPSAMENGDRRPPPPQE
jgi:periplasmic protein CpxP/Spy